MTYRVQRGPMLAALAVGLLVWGAVGAGDAGAQASQLSEAAAVPYGEATRMIASGDFAGARARLQQVLALDPDFPRAHFDLGYAAEQLGDLPAAIAAYSKAYELDPGNADYQFALGTALYMAEDYERALEVFTSREGMTDPRLWLQRGRTEEKLGMLDQAAASMRKATELDPNYADAYYELGSVEYDRATSSNDFAAAIAAYERALELDPGHVNAYVAHFRLGRMHYKLEDFDAAASQYQQAIDLKPEFAPGYVSLGETEAKRKNNEAAIAAYEKAIEIRAPAPYGMAQYKLARVYWAQDEPEAAIAAYQKAIEDPDFQYADNARANIASLEEYIAKKKKAQRGGY